MKPPSPTSFERGGEKSSNKTRKAVKKNPKYKKKPTPNTLQIEGLRNIVLASASPGYKEIKMYWHKMWQVVLCYSGHLRKRQGHLSKRITPIKNGILQRNKTAFSRQHSPAEQ